MVTIRFKTVALVAFLTLLIPVAIFFLGWLRPLVSIPATLILAGGFVWLWRKDYSKKHDTLELPVVHLVIIMLCIVAWVFVSGAVGYFKSSVDIPWRTACLRDLITYDWPIVYPDTGYGFSYYVTFWLPVALIGKLVGMQAALALLCLYLSHFVIVTYLLVLFLLKIEKPGQMWIAFFVFVLWSGLVVVGEALLWCFGYAPTNGHIDDSQRFADIITADSDLYFIFRSNFGIINNVYNQVAIWPALLLTLHNRRPRSFLFLGLVLLGFSPWGIIGIIIPMIALALPWLADVIKHRDPLRFVREIFSPCNVAALITCLPIYYLFLFKAGGEGVTSAAQGITLINVSAFTPTIVAVLVLFYVLEFGIYCILVGPSYWRSPLFWAVIIALLLIPFIRIGSAGWDFCLNVSIPAFSTLMIFVISVLCRSDMPLEIVAFAYFGEDEQKRISVMEGVTHVRVLRVLLAVAFVLGALSPLISMGGKALNVVQTKSITEGWMDTTYTFADKTPETESSLVTGAADREGLFYEYIAR